MLDHLLIGVADKIAAGGKVQFVAGIERALTVNARGDQVEGAVEVALAALENLQGASGVARVEVFEALVNDFGGADQESCAGGIDEVAAVEGDAVGVGQYVVSRSAEDFLGTLDA
ncbi:hypothetical protein D3C77_285610 [compost metagenome]